LVLLIFLKAYAMNNRKILTLAIACIIQMWSIPAFANQWVTGTVSQIEEYGGFNNGSFGIRVFIGNAAWVVIAGGSTNGPANCTSFRIVVGAQGVDENIKNRMYSMLLTAYTSHNPVSLYVETDTSGPYCYVAITSTGTNPQ
jgi:hypothetical protein